MAVDDPGELERIDQEIRINELREAAKEAAGEEMTVWESEDAPPEIMEQFWSNVLEYEKAPWTSTFEQLSRAGVELPPPGELSDEALTVKLWELIAALAKMKNFLHNTDHLSDRELYTHLYEETLHEEVKDVSFADGAYVIDILGSYGDEEMYLYHKYYADEEQRANWQKDWPNDEMPPHEDPPYDRDRLLPKSEF